MSVKRRPEWDINQIVAFLGGVASTRLRIEKLGIDPPTENAIRLWMHRGRVPGDWTAPLLLILGPKKTPTFIVEPEGEDISSGPVPVDDPDDDPFGEVA